MRSLNSANGLVNYLKTAKKKCRLLGGKSIYF